MGSKKVLITGATGFLGSYIFKEILMQTDYEVHLLIREKDQINAEERIGQIFHFFKDDMDTEKFSNRIKVFNGDLSRDNLGLDSEIYKKLNKQIDEIYHIAANTDFRMTLLTARQTNVTGAENILRFAKKCFKKIRVNYISTAFIAGAQTGLFLEQDPITHFKKFNNAYEQSKFEAELLMERYRKLGLDISIFRPSIVMGEYLSGKTTSFKMFYQPLKFFYQEIFDFIPLNESSPYNFIPVDLCAKAIVRLSLDNTMIRTFHIVNRDNMSLGHMMDILSKYLSVKKVKYVSPYIFNKNEKSVIRKKIIEPFIPYFNLKITFGCSESYRILKNLGFEMPRIDEQFLFRTLKYCQESGFLKERLKK